MSRLRPDQNLDLTWGIELEGQARFKNNGYLGANDISDALWQWLDDNDYFCSDSVLVDNEETYWKVVDDASIVCDDYNLEGFELVSRVMQDRPDDFREVKLALDKLRGEFHVSTNETTGFHVHVGCFDKSFGLRTLQNLAIIATAFEHVLSRLHPETRQHSAVACEFGRAEFHCSGPAELYPVGLFLLHGMTTDQAENLTVYDRLEALLGTTRWCELQTLLGYTRYAAYNLEPALPRLRSPHGHRTVEFRQAAGTFDPEKVQRWVKTCLGVVRYAHCCDDAQLADLLNNVGRSDFDASGLFEAMGLDDIAKQCQEGDLYSLSEHVKVPTPSIRGMAAVTDSVMQRAFSMSEIDRRMKSTGRLPIEEEIACPGFRGDVESTWVPYEGHAFKYPKSYLHKPLPTLMPRPSEPCQIPSAGSTSLTV